MISSYPCRLLEGACVFVDPSVYHFAVQNNEGRICGRICAFQHLGPRICFKHMFETLYAIFWKPTQYAVTSQIQALSHWSHSNGFFTTFCNTKKCYLCWLLTMPYCLMDGLVHLLCTYNMMFKMPSYVLSNDNGLTSIASCKLPLYPSKTHESSFLPHMLLRSYKFIHVTNCCLARPPGAGGM